LKAVEFVSEQDAEELDNTGKKQVGFRGQDIYG
jgi:hypothetical protein